MALDGNDIMEYRKAAGFTQEEAAKLLCVDVRTVRRWEKGESKMTRIAMRIFKQEIIARVGSE